MTINDNELELAILKKYVKQHKLIGENNSNKCSRELDMRNVLKEITGDENQNLEYDAKLWLDRLTTPRSKGILKPCSDSTLNNTTHKYHARAFRNAINDQPTPAWDRIRELQEIILKQKDKKEDILVLKPNFFGIGFDLKPIWEKIRNKLNF